MAEDTEGYGFGVTIDLDPEQAEERMRAALAEEGFGILTEIDVTATLNAKLGVSWAPYRILGACNPQLAHRALQAEQDIGLLLPCNIIVYQDDHGTAVRVLEPELMARVTSNPAIEPVAAEARVRLQRALETLKESVEESGADTATRR